MQKFFDNIVFNFKYNTGFPWVIIFLNLQSLLAFAFPDMTSNLYILIILEIINLAFLILLISMFYVKYKDQMDYLDNEKDVEEILEKHNLPNVGGDKREEMWFGYLFAFFMTFLSITILIHSISYSGTDSSTNYINTYGNYDMILFYGMLVFGIIYLIYKNKFKKRLAKNYIFFTLKTEYIKELMNEVTDMAIPNLREFLEKRNLKYIFIKNNLIKISGYKSKEHANSLIIEILNNFEDYIENCIIKKDL